MIEALSWSAVGLFALGVVSVCVLAARRLQLARSDRRRRIAEERLRPFALALVEGTAAGLPEPGGPDAPVLAGLLERYALQVRGSSRERIAEFFERRGDVEREIRALSGVRAWRRATAAHLLGTMGSPRAQRSLRAALGDPRQDVRAAAARSLGRLGAPEAVRPLVYSLVRNEIPRAVVASALLAIGPTALPPLRALLVHPEAEVKTIAVELIGLLGDASDAPALAERLTDTSAEVRAKAARALGRIGAQEEAAGLRAALEDRIPFVRAAAANALGMIGDGDAADALLARAQKDRFEAAQAAARALARVDRSLLASAARSSASGPHVAEAADLLGIRG